MPKSRPPPVSTGAGSAGLPAPDGRAGSHRTDCGRAGSGMAVLLSAEGRQFEPTAQAIRNWVAQAERDEGRRADGLSSAEREEMRRLRRENLVCVKNGRDWQQVRRASEGSTSVNPSPDERLVCSGGRTREVYRFMRASQAPLRIATMARVPGASPATSGFDAVASTRAFGTRAQRRCLHCPRAGDSCTQPGEALRGAAHSGRAGRAGPAGERAKRVARVMRQAGLAGVSRRKGPRTTRRDAQARPAPDLVEREFHADAPDRL